MPPRISCTVCKVLFLCDNWSTGSRYNTEPEDSTTCLEDILFDNLMRKMTSPWNTWPLIDDTDDTPHANKGMSRTHVYSLKMMIQ